MDWARWPSFSEAEMTCRCGCGRADMNAGFMNLLQGIRDQLARPLVVTSGFRCPEHNAAVGGKPSSQHLIGRAADIVTNANLAHCLVRAAIPLMRGVGIGAIFIHLDNRDGLPVLWTY